MTNASPSVLHKVVDYLYYLGYVRREPGMERRNPSGTLGEDWPRTSMLDILRLERTHWALLPHQNLIWEELAADVAPRSAKWEVSLAHDSTTDIHVRLRIQGKFPQSHEGTFQVPKTIRSSLTFLLHPRDAGYVERMEGHLFDGDVTSPSTDVVSSSKMVYVGDNHHRQMAAYGFAANTGRILSLEDFQTTAWIHHDTHKVVFHGLRGDPTQVVCGWEAFPLFPTELAALLPPRGLAVRLPPVAYYFGALAADAEGPLRARLVTAFRVELAIAVVAAIVHEWSTSGRVWLTLADIIA